MPASPISKTPISSVDPKRFFGRAEQPEGGVPLALEAEHGVDEVLEGLGTGDRTVLRHVADEDDGDALALGEVHEAERRLADLADAAGGAVELVDGGGLDRIDDDEGRLGCPRDLGDPTDVALCEDVDPLADGPPRRPRRVARSRTWPGDSSPDA